MNDEKFRQWTNSYLVLTSAERKAYDHQLRQSHGMEQPPDALSGLSRAALMLVEAEASLVRRRLNEAAESAKAAVKQESKNAAGYALLGDVLREQGQHQNALTMYNYAIQFDPNNRRYWQLLEEVTALREGRAVRKYARERSSVLNRPPSAWVGAGLSLVLVALSILFVRSRWGDPLVFSLPANLAYVAVADGFVLGLVLAATSIIGPIDDELLWYRVPGVGTETTPVGVFVALPALVFFWAAPAFYSIIAMLDEYFSLSIVIALATTSLLTVVLGVLAPPEGRTSVYLLAGNFVFVGFLFGWLIGSMRSRAFEH
jgi:tetratricopeptide (TPR) repeat protein